MQRATAIAVKTPTISTASGGCARSGGFAFHAANRCRGSADPVSESGQAATRAFGATARYANAAGTERAVSIVAPTRSISTATTSVVSPLGAR